MIARIRVKMFTDFNCYTLQLHYNVVVGVHGEKPRYNGPRCIHATVVQKL